MKISDASPTQNQEGDGCQVLRSACGGAAGGISMNRCKYIPVTQRAINIIKTIITRENIPPGHYLTLEGPASAFTCI